MGRLFGLHCMNKSLRADWLIAPELITGFCSMKRLGVFLLPLDGMLVHRRSFPHNLLGFPNNLPASIYTPGWREPLWEFSVLPKNTTQCPWPGLKPRLLASGTSALTIRPPCLPVWKKRMSNNFHILRVIMYSKPVDIDRWRTSSSSSSNSALL